MAETLRQQLRTPGIIELPGAYDTLSAMILEQVGFKTCFLSGYGVAASRFGNPDIGLTSLTETAEATKSICNALKIPVIVDADNGYGNEDNVIRTVYELEHSGAAGMIMEDQVMPKRCGHTGGKKIVPLPHYLTKLTVAIKSRQTPLVIVARTDAMDLNEGIDRAKAFYDRGADVVLIDGLASIEACERVAKEVPGLKLINYIYGGKTPILPAKQLSQMGFKMVLYSTPALYVATKALFHYMKMLKESSNLNSMNEASLTFKEFQIFMDERYFSRPYSAHVLRTIYEEESKKVA
jgi:methylisocitrate lyase